MTLLEHRSKKDERNASAPPSKVDPHRLAAIAAQRSSGDSPVLDLARYVPALFVLIADRLTSGSSTLYRRHFGVGTTEWRIMVRLATEPWCTPQALGRWIGLDKAAISRSIKSMERRALVAVRPHPSDNRSYVLALTEMGRRLHDRVIRVAFEREERLLSCLTLREREHLVDMLIRMRRCLAFVNGPIEIPGEPGTQASTEEQ